MTTKLTQTEVQPDGGKVYAVAVDGIEVGTVHSRRTTRGAGMAGGRRYSSGTVVSYRWVARDKTERSPAFNTRREAFAWLTR